MRIEKILFGKSRPHSQSALPSSESGANSFLSEQTPFCKGVLSREANRKSHRLSSLEEMEETCWCTVVTIKSLSD